jgi:hypothetical protein
MSIVPREVKAAMAIDFGLAVTGYLVCVIESAPVFAGIVYADRRGRFEDGTSIRTSIIRGISFQKGYGVLSTFSGSCYVIVSWYPSQTNEGNLYMNRTWH